MTFLTVIYSIFLECSNAEEVWQCIKHNTKQRTHTRVGQQLAATAVRVRVLMAIAGHSQISTTQRYIDLRPSVVKAAVELI